MSNVSCFLGAICFNWIVLIFFFALFICLDGNVTCYESSDICIKPQWVIPYIEIIAKDRVRMACFAFKTCKNDAMLKCCRIFRVSVVFNMDTLYFPLFVDTCLKLKVVFIYLYVLRVIFRCRCITYTLTYTIHLFLCIPYYRQMLSEPS